MTHEPIDCQACGERVLPIDGDCPICGKPASKVEWVNRDTAGRVPDTTDYHIPSGSFTVNIDASGTTTFDSTTGYGFTLF